MCCCCDSYCCYKFGRCLKHGSIFLGIAAAAVLITGVVLIIVIFGGPLRKIKIGVDDASLTRFDLVSTPSATALAYNLSLTMSVRNPNWAIAIEHDKPLEAAYSFDGQQFDRLQLADKGEKLATRKTVVYHPFTHSDGRSVALGNAGEAEFKKENATRTFEVEVKLTGRFKYKLRKNKCEFQATCPLKLQLAPAGAPALVFQKVECELAKTDDNDKHCKMVY